MRFAKYVWILIVAFALAAAPQAPKKAPAKAAPKPRRRRPPGASTSIRPAKRN